MVCVVYECMDKLEKEGNIDIELLKRLIDYSYKLTMYG